MRQALRILLMYGLFFLVTVPALAQDEEPKKAPPSAAATQKERGAFMQTIIDLFTDPLFLIGLVALVALVGVLIYVKKKQADDD